MISLRPRRAALVYAIFLTSLGVTRAWAVCPLTPDVTCKFSLGATLSYADVTPDDKDKLAFKLSKGANTFAGDFGDPTTTDSYDVCIYANGTLLPSMSIPADGNCDDGGCWTMKPKGPAFKDKLGVHDGVTGIGLSAPTDSSDKTKVGVKGKGANLPDLGLPIAEPIAVQVRNSLGDCWGAIFTGTTQDAVAGKLKAKVKLESLPSCSDASRNGFETDTDCGGPCSGCGFGLHCSEASDCDSGICNAGTCASKRVFVTSTTTNGAFGGLSQGDALCQARAAAASLGGTWVAWLSTSSVNAIDRILDTEYRMVDGTLVIPNKAQITGSSLPLAAIELTESGATMYDFAWTGTNNNGSYITNCADWTSTSSSGWVGKPNFPVGWSAYGTMMCSMAHHLICFEQ